MASVEIEHLVTEVDPENPTGEDLAYDPAFIDLERRTTKKSESAIEGQDQEVDQTDWQGVVRDAAELLRRTKDLRLAVLLARALVHTDGLPGLAQGLSLVRQLLENYWDNLFPLLDPEDDNDPTERMNIITSLCDRESILQPLSNAPLVSIKGWGSYSFQDVRNAKNTSTDSSEGAQEVTASSIGQIKAAFMECAIEDLKAMSEALTTAESSLASIDKFLMERVGSDHAPDMNALLERIREISSVVNEFLLQRGESTSAAMEEGNVISAIPQPAEAADGEINSREAAMKMMDKISDYFRQTEPSSPIPLLMQRAKRLSTMGFMEIVKDLAPDGLPQVQNISGIDPE